MAMSDNRSKNKRANLFLLRVWCDDTDEHEQEYGYKNGDENEGPCRVWHGKVQRTVSGEVHSFDAKDDLIEVLETMLYKEWKEQREQGRPRGTTSSEASVLANGNNQNQTEANKGDNHVQ